MRKPLRGGEDLTVAVLHWALPPTVGGVESHLADYIRLLHGRGVKVVAFTGTRPSREVRKYATVETHPLLHLDGSSTAPVDTPERVAELTAWMERSVRKHGINVVHGHNLHRFSGAPAMAVNALAPKYLLVRQHTFHNYWRDAQFADLLVDWDGRWANSDFVARKCGEQYSGKIPEKHIFGVDVDRFRCSRVPFQDRDLNARSPKNAPVILQPARLLRWKGPLESVHMLSRLHRAGYPARLVLTDSPSLIDWDGERAALRGDLTRLIRELRLTEWVSFVGDARYQDMPRLYDDADIVINPSRDEPLGLVPLEAMAASRPVVATYSGGMKETVNRKVGTLIDYGREEKDTAYNLFRAVRTLLNNPAKAVLHGEAGYEHVAQNFQMKSYVDKMLREYRDVRRQPRRDEVQLVESAYPGALQEAGLATV
jgi:glycosyltransferase involved in cell wall biosynthesis